VAYVLLIYPLIPPYWGYTATRKTHGKNTANTWRPKHHATQTIPRPQAHKTPTTQRPQAIRFLDPRKGQEKAPPKDTQVQTARNDTRLKRRSPGSLLLGPGRASARGARVGPRLWAENGCANNALPFPPSPQALVPTRGAMARPRSGPGQPRPIRAPAYRLSAIRTGPARSVFGPARSRPGAILGAYGQRRVGRARGAAPEACAGPRNVGPAARTGC